MFLLLAVTPSTPADVNIAAIVAPIVVVVTAVVIVFIVILLVYMHHQRRSQSMSVSDKPLPLRNNSYAPAVTTIDPGVKDKRDSTLEDVELPDQYCAEDFGGRNSEDCFI